MLARLPAWFADQPPPAVDTSNLRRSGYPQKDTVTGSRLEPESHGLPLVRRRR